MRPVACTLASGSKGNAALVSDGRTHILIDAGISARRIDTALHTWGLSVADLSGVLVTHEHTDHTAGLARLKLPIFASGGTCAALEKHALPLTELRAGRSYELGSIGFSPFRTPHDTPESFGYLVHIDDFRVCLCTDLGMVTPAIQEAVSKSHYLMIEANHDVDLLCSGPYPAFLKDRVLGPRGHLSNEACAAAVVKAVQAGTTRVTLCHLSDENNSPDLALAAVAEALYNAGIIPGQDVELDAAPAGEVGAPYRQTSLRAEASAC